MQHAPPTTSHEVVIYHDECKHIPGGLKAHGLLFVPTCIAITDRTPLFGPDRRDYRPLERLLDQMHQIRTRCRLDSKLHFNQLSGTKWGRRAQAYRYFVELAVDALRSKRPVHFRSPLCCKLAIMVYPAKTEFTQYGGGERKEQRLRFDETMLRTTLKGAVHYLYGDSQPVNVRAIVSDGHPYHRRLDDKRVRCRLLAEESRGRTPLRGYVEFARSAGLYQLSSDHREYLPSTRKFVHANMLQLVDLLLGSVRHVCFGDRVTDWPAMPRFGREVPKKDVVAYPVKQMLDKECRGTAFRYSGHFGSFSVSRLSFAGDSLTFSGLTPPRHTRPSENLALLRE